MHLQAAWAADLAVGMTWARVVSARARGAPYRTGKRPRMNSADCHLYSEFAVKSEAFHDRLVRMGPSQKYRVGWFFQTILVKEA